MSGLVIAAALVALFALPVGLGWWAGRAPASRGRSAFGALVSFLVSAGLIGLVLFLLAYGVSKRRRLA